MGPVSKMYGSQGTGLCRALAEIVAYPSITSRVPNSVLMFAQRLRRCTNIKTALDLLLVSAW